MNHFTKKEVTDYILSNVASLYDLKWWQFSKKRYYTKRMFRWFEELIELE